MNTPISANNNDRLALMRREVGRCFTEEDYEKLWHRCPYLLQLGFPDFLEDKYTILALFEGLESLRPRRFGKNGLIRKFYVQGKPHTVLCLEFFGRTGKSFVAPFIMYDPDPFNSYSPNDRLWGEWQVRESEWIDRRLPILQEAVAKLQELSDRSAASLV